MALVKVVLRGVRRVLGLLTEGLVAYGAFVSPIPLPGIYPVQEAPPARRRRVATSRRRGPHRCPPDGRRRSHYAAFRCAAAVRRS